MFGIGLAVANVIKAAVEFHGCRELDSGLVPFMPALRTEVEAV